MSAIRRTPTSVGRFEHLVLIATLVLKDEAYAVSIGNEILERTGTRPARGAVYTTLVRLEDKGLLRSSMGEPTAIRGGKAKRFYELTAAGRAALRAAHSELVTAWPSVGRLLDASR